MGFRSRSLAVTIAVLASVGATQQAALADHKPPNQGNSTQPSDACFDQKVPPDAGLGVNQNSEFGDDDIAYLIAETLGGLPLVGSIAREAFEAVDDLRGGRNLGAQGFGPDQSKRGHPYFTDVCGTFRIGFINLKIAGVYVSVRDAAIPFLRPFAAVQGGNCNVTEIVVRWDTDALISPGNNYQCI